MAREDLRKKYEEKRARLGLKAKWGREEPRDVRLVQEHAVYAAMVEAMDLAVGKVLAKLDELGLRENTLVIFTSDNGGLSTSEGWPTSNLPLRGGKGWMYEGGIREPLLVRWPAVVKAGSVISTPVSSPDFFPTLLEAAGAKPQPGQTLDGVSLDAGAQRRQRCRSARFSGTTRITAIKAARPARPCGAATGSSSSGWRTGARSFSTSRKTSASRPTSPQKSRSGWRSSAMNCTPGRKPSARSSPLPIRPTIPPSPTDAARIHPPGKRTPKNRSVKHPAFSNVAMALFRASVRRWGEADAKAIGPERRTSPCSTRAPSLRPWWSHAGRR